MNGIIRTGNANRDKWTVWIEFTDDDNPEYAGWFKVHDIVYNKLKDLGQTISDIFNKPCKLLVDGKTLININF